MAEVVINDKVKTHEEGKHTIYWEVIKGKDSVKQVCKT